MAIAVDATSTGGQTTTATTLTWSHTCTGDDLILWVGVSEEGADDVSTVTYNGVGLTELTQSGTVVGAGFSQMWYLVGPDTGANNIVITRAGTTGRLTGDAVSYTGASQTGVPDSQAATTASSASTFNISTTVVASNCWIVGYSDNSTGGQSAGTGTVIRRQGSDSSTLIDSDGVVATGSVALQLTSAGSNWTGAVASFKPVVSGPENLKSLNTNAKANIKSHNTNVIANIKSINTNS